MRGPCRRAIKMTIKSFELVEFQDACLSGAEKLELGRVPELAVATGN
jgi:hypothetical protein